MFEYLTLITASIVLASNSLFTTPPTPHEQLQVSQCLAQKITAQYTVLAENDEFKIIDILPTDIPQITELAEQVQCGTFINVSTKLNNTLQDKKGSAEYLLREQAVKSLKKVTGSSNKYEISHQTIINSALDQISADNIWQTLNHLTAYPNRAATQDTGLATANWLKSTFETMATESQRTDTKTFFVTTGWIKQPSLVTVIGSNLKTPAIVIGAHMDTPEGRRMPGADEGSGAASLIETARVLLNSKAQLKHPVYIIWYAAGSKNFAGSQYVAQYFRDKSIAVKAILQLDKTGYRANYEDPTMWIYNDYTDKDLSVFLAKLIVTYIHVPLDYSRCDYKCSDHTSWSEEGFTTSFASESNVSDLNPYIGSSSDTMDFLNLEHMTNFSKLALAFALELAAE